MDKMTKTATQSLPKVTEVELVYRNKKSASERPSIRTALDAFDLFVRSWDENKIELQEQFRIMLLDQKHSCIGISTIATGGIANCFVDLKIAFGTAVKARASALILAHNHPSGNRAPSEDDKKLTTLFQIAGEVLGIGILDHLIITKEGYTSLSEKNLMQLRK